VQLNTLTSTFLLEGLKEPDNRTIWRSFDERYRPLINSYARRAFGLRNDEAEDSAQLTLTAFADAYRQGKYDRSKGRLSSWLFGIATRQIRNQLRRSARNPEVQVARESNATAFAERIPDDHELETVWEKQWQAAVFWQCFEEIRPRFHTNTIAAFELFGRAGWPAAKVAEHLGMTENAVFLARHKILKGIRELIPRMSDVW